MTMFPIFTFVNSKGGVGKSSVATAIARMLAKTKKVALLDADFCSSNTEQIMKIKHKYAEFSDDKDGYHIKPRQITNNLEFMAITCLQKRATTGVQQDGVYQASALQMMVDIQWGNPDLMIIDMPAGTDDLFTTLSTKLKDRVKGIFIITQPKTLIDSKRIIELCGLKGLPILGVIENMEGSHMSCHDKAAACPECGKVFAPFGISKAKPMCENLGIDYIAPIKLTDGDFYYEATGVLAKVLLKIWEAM